ncbi:MAG TPA: aminotransferase [Spirochaetia bacterium]|nr:MAG: aminotransferase [Spirochaetes bacterium GWE1_32_154]OHD47029.1 MAG: aminotransferase [Spirochaetes bacterium GWE2_31_10]HBD94265.1 aminotransferase [Spirochaetia bacterium]
MNKKIFVTQPSLPSLDEFIPYLEKIWNNKVLTNNGEFHKKLEKELAEYLGVEFLSLFCNGTIALLTALQTLEITGDVITTPYSFVATAHSIKWNNLNPVFVDIDPESFCLDPTKIEQAITEKTTAIMPVHVYGWPCNCDDIQKIADKYHLKVIYDAAHAFNVKYKNETILKHGDLSVLSFHATKVYNTIEGGAIISHNIETKNRIDKLKNFGFAGETSVIESGINGKMNEIQAAFGLMYLKKVDSYIEKRKHIFLKYTELLFNVTGVQLKREQPDVVYNYAYFPVQIDKDLCGKSRDEVYEYLKTKNIFCRRYFYPLITDFVMYKETFSLATAKQVADQIICLPIYPDLNLSDVEIICDTIINFINVNL